MRKIGYWFAMWWAFWKNLIVTTIYYMPLSKRTTDWARSKRYEYVEEMQYWENKWEPREEGR